MGAGLLQQKEPHRGSAWPRCEPRAHREGTRQSEVCARPARHPTALSFHLPLLEIIMTVTKPPSPEELGAAGTHAGAAAVQPPGPAVSPGQPGTGRCPPAGMGGQSQRALHGPGCPPSSAAAPEPPGRWRRPGSAGSPLPTGGGLARRLCPSDGRSDGPGPAASPAADTAPGSAPGEAPAPEAEGGHGPAARSS